MLISIWIWSGHALASIISTPFCWHSFRNITPISCFICPYISIRRYLGANTMWYWHLQLVCSKLLMSLSFTMRTSLFLYLCGRQTTLTLTGSLFLFYFTPRYKLFFYPRPSRGLPLVLPRQMREASGKGPLAFLGNGGAAPAAFRGENYSIGHGGPCLFRRKLLY